MPSPRFEVPSGDIDGVNVEYQTSRPYKPGTTAVFVNGSLQERSLDDGWAETDPVTGIVTLKEPLRPGGGGDGPDTIQVFYVDTSPALPETEVCNIKGKVQKKRELAGKISTSMRITGYVKVCSGGA